MPHRTFFWFILPSALARLLFIAFPLVSLIVQSLHVEQEQVLTTSENSGPFGCKQSTSVDVAVTAKLKEAAPLGRFNGLGTYLDRDHLGTAEISAAWSGSDSCGQFLSAMMNLPFHKALAFNLAYTVVVTPLVILLGLAVALGVNGLPELLKGPTIFILHLPIIVTPRIGSLILYWIIDADGIFGKGIRYILDDPTLSLKASPLLTWLALFAYGVWHGIPFAFVVFYAGLQTFPEETLEAAMIDGASRWERIRYIVIP